MEKFKLVCNFSTKRANKRIIYYRRSVTCLEFTSLDLPHMPDDISAGNWTGGLTPLGSLRLLMKTFKNIKIHILLLKKRFFSQYENN